jgi:hypothetical protein
MTVAELIEALQQMPQHYEVELDVVGISNRMTYGGEHLELTSRAIYVEQSGSRFSIVYISGE